jgi:hypothetical protein
VEREARSVEREARSVEREVWSVKRFHPEGIFHFSFLIFNFLDVSISRISS